MKISASTFKIVKTYELLETFRVLLGFNFKIKKIMICRSLYYFKNQRWLTIDVILISEPSNSSHI